MRQIKFRAWDPEANRGHKWIFDGFAVSEDGKFLQNMHERGEYSGEYGDKIILMQFTGLLDKNSKEIYEGDIVEIDFEGSKEKGQIIWENKRSRFMWLDNRNDDYGIFEIDRHGRKIVGNIYENPELLK